MILLLLALALLTTTLPGAVAGLYFVRQMMSIGG